MKTSCSSSSLALLALLGACGSKPPAEQCSNDDSPPVVGHPEEAMLHARVTVETEATFDSAGAAKRAHSASAALTDVSSVITKDRQVNSLTYPCYGLTGAPTRVCRPGLKEPCNVERLEADKVIVEGLAGGSKELPRTSAGAYLMESTSDPLYAAAEVSAKIVGRDSKGYFPSVELAVGVADALAVTAPAPNATVGARDLKISWKGGTGDYVVINLSDATGKITDDVQCVVKDDGCHTVSAGDLDWAGLKAGAKIKLTLSRERKLRKLVGTSASLIATTASRVELQLVR
jgi:hypothetical protein